MEKTTGSLSVIDEVLKSIESKKKEKVEETRFGNKPPKDGVCKRCGQQKPLNRLKLCYSCWVKTNLEKSGWSEDTPHPFWCGCSDCTFTLGENN